jgi:hypothetical protein
MPRAVTVIASILVGGLIARFAFSQGPADKAVPANPSLPGRYQMALEDASAAHTKVVVCDTATGQCWIWQTTYGGRWSDLGSPLTSKSGDEARPDAEDGQND